MHNEYGMKHTHVYVSYVRLNLYGTVHVLILLRSVSHVIDFVWLHDILSSSYLGTGLEIVDQKESVA